MTIEDALVDVHGHVAVTFTVSEDDLPLAAADVMALGPRFTLASLQSHPVDGLRAWRSQVLVGATIPTLRPGGPGTPAGLVVVNGQQPGAETPAALTALPGGRLRYVFAAALSGFDPDDTLRVGLFLAKAKKPSLRTAATHDFRPSGGPMEERETVLDQNCAQCHGAAVVHHDGRAGVRLCETCHTWQNADPDTIDPAALVTAATTARTDPNPLELGRLVHRIHRGKTLPTLYYASSRANPAPALGARNDLPLPFTPENNVTAIVGRRFSIVGFRSSELITGRVVQRTDNGMPARTVVQGVAFPRELRDCAACHDRAGQAYMVKTAISRRTCGSCHPDVWFQPTPDTLDEGHLAHTGGPQADDTRCRGCHVEAGPGERLYAPLDELHVPLPQGPRYGAPVLEIVSVTGLTPGDHPSIRFRLSDRIGPVVPSLSAPVPLWEPDSATSSLLPRKLSSFTIRLAGPITADSPDYAQNNQVISSGLSAGNPDPLTLTTDAGSDEYVYTFSSVIPGGAEGTWAVGMEARKQLKYALYDKSRDTFRWPYTGETVRESPDNPVVYVHTSNGTYQANPGRRGPGASPRRKVVSQEKCNLCHGRIELHGRSRHDVEYCLFCHSPATTDYPNRRKVNGVVDLNQSFDRIEERSVHFKVMNHRIHTGGRTGSATLEGIAPFMIASFFYDDAGYPNDLANCTACHEGKSYLLEAVPANAAPTVANETATVVHSGSAVHAAGEAAVPPVTAACLGCHAAGATFAHVALNTTPAGEQCSACHKAGALGVEIAHGLAAPSSTTSSRFSSLVERILVPRCASTACHGPGATPPRLDAGGGWAALVGVQSGQSSLRYVEPNAPEKSYLVHKVRGTAQSVGGSTVTLMPPDGALAPADVAAIEAWISNGAPND